MFANTLQSTFCCILKNDTKFNNYCIGAQLKGIHLVAYDQGREERFNFIEGFQLDAVLYLQCGTIKILETPKLNRV